MPVPVPDYEAYKQELCERYNFSLPLKQIPACSIVEIPLPLNQLKRGWPWDEESDSYPAEKSTQAVSVIIPSYQQGAYIEEAIRSALLQNYGPLELIIIDGASTDNTVEVMNHYSNFISMWVSEPDNGQAHAINKGFAMASGSYFYWLNSDDFLTKNCFRQVMPMFAQYPNTDIIYGDGYKLNEDTGSIAIEPAPLVRERYLRFGGIVLSHAVIWKRSAHSPVWEDLNCAMDAELWLRLFTDRVFRHSLLPMGVARQHSLQKTAVGGAWSKRWEEDYTKYIWQYYPQVKNWLWRTREYRLVQKLFTCYRSIF